MKRKLNILLFFLTITNITFSQNVGLNIARKVAENFYSQYSKNKSLGINANVVYSKVSNEDTLIYIFNMGNEGFVIVAGDYSAVPVLGFSDEGNFISYNNAAPALLDLLEAYSEKISYLKSQKKLNCRTKDWDNILLHYKNKANDNIREVKPFITTKWGQEGGYNLLCPEYPTATNGHCPTGCVATAMAQIMNYYKYPQRGVGSNSYYHSTFGLISANFASSDYEWSKMTITWNNLNKEDISKLMFHCGVAVNMNYRPTESGSNIYSAYLALKKYFNYRLTISYEERKNYKDAEWRTMILDNLDQKQPILYGGSGEKGGHAFICDGYKDTAYLHFNWGWDGKNNGYYRIDSLVTPLGDFNKEQNAVMNIVPFNASYCSGTRVFYDSIKTIDDGSGYSYYKNNTVCSYLISPPTNSGILLTFNKFSLEDGKDFVYIYDGSNSTAPLLGKFSGHDIPNPIIAKSGKMFITFSSDSLTQDLGWEATYETLTSGIENSNISQSNVVVFPIPSKDKINIIISKNISEKKEINIYNILGQKKISMLNKTSWNDNIGTIDMASLEQGVYIMELKVNELKIYKKIIKK